MSKFRTLLLSVVLTVGFSASAQSQSVAGHWRIVGDTNAAPGLELTLVELGPELVEGVIVRGTWLARRVGCEPASSPSCFTQGEVLGIRKASHIDLELARGTPAGMWGSAALDVTEAGLTGGVGVAFTAGSRPYISPNVKLLRAK